MKGRSFGEKDGICPILLAVLNIDTKPAKDYYKKELM